MVNDTVKSAIKRKCTLNEYDCTQKGDVMDKYDKFLAHYNREMEELKAELARKDEYIRELAKRVLPFLKSEMGMQLTPYGIETRYGIIVELEALAKEGE